jgi:zinc-ribbon domain
MSQRFCSSCGAALDEGAKFCRKCGTPVADASATSEPPASPKLPEPPQPPQPPKPPPPSSPQPPRAPSPPATPPAASRPRRDIPKKPLAIAAAVVLAVGGGFALTSALTGGDEDPPATEPAVQEEVATPPEETTPPVEPTPEEPPAEEAAGELDTDEAASIIEEYFSAISDRDWDTAWALQSEHYRSAKIEDPDYADGTLDTAPAKWKRDYRTESLDLDPSGAQVEVLEYRRGGSEAIVRVTGMTFTPSEPDCYTGKTWFLLEDGAWRYDPGYAFWPHRERRYDRSRYPARFRTLLGVTCSRRS